MRFGLKWGVLLLAFLCILAGEAVTAGEGKLPSREREMEVERKLKVLNKPAVKSIQTDYGDIIDCIDIYKQPAFDHPLLKNHTIQMRPKHDPSSDKMKDAAAANSSHPSPSPVSSPAFMHAWRKNGSCPTGTIPVRRIQRHHLLNAPSLENYGRKVSHGVKKHEIHLAGRTINLGKEDLHTSAVMVAGGLSYTGAKANINVWNPYVEYNDEYSAGLIRLRSGPYNNADFIEAGWMVNPGFYGDSKTHFYIYWTGDSGKTTGCFNLACSGFVQTNTEIVLGSPIEPTSSEFGGQYHITLYVFKDYDKDGSWWLVWGENTVLGYWPNTLFSDLSGVATVVEWGGDVYSTRLHTRPHTATRMGSGELAWDHFGFAAFIQYPRMRDYSMTLKYPDPVASYTPQPDCYSGEQFAEVRFAEPLYFWGGPGKSQFCP